MTYIVLKAPLNSNQPTNRRRIRNGVAEIAGVDNAGLDNDGQVEEVYVQSRRVENCRELMHLL